ncbi:PIN domain-containing protein [Candidatus Curtissbacteria bacterium]|nr:PIN domain-containing protein [Candidatus Curtissbacteria bacterium]
MVFVDSNVFIAIWDLDNIHHQIAYEKSRNLANEGEPVVISNIVIYEVATIMAMRLSKQKSLAFLDSIRKSEFKIIFIDQQIDRLAHDIFEKIKDKNVSFFDCTSFAIIQKFDIGKIFSFDKDFLKYGKNLGWQFV